MHLSFVPCAPDGEVLGSRKLRVFIVLRWSLNANDGIDRRTAGQDLFVGSEFDYRDSRSDISFPLGFYLFQNLWCLFAVYTHLKPSRIVFPGVPVLKDEKQIDIECENDQGQHIEDERNNLPPMSPSKLVLSPPLIRTIWPPAMMQGGIGVVFSMIFHCNAF